MRFRTFALLTAVWFGASTAVQAQVGLQRLALDDGRMPSVVFYPTGVPARAQTFGPFDVTVAPGAEPTAGRHPLLLVSHGTGGQEFGHAWLAERLVRKGWIVVAVRHPGDNYQDRAGVTNPDYFVERPRQLSRALDQVLADRRWAPLIDPERIAAFGHSAGGHTVLALAGARPDAAQIARHCSAQGPGPVEDAAMCALGGYAFDRLVPASGGGPAPQDVRDGRIRAVVAAQPLAQGLDAASLARVDLAVHVETSGRDEVLAPAWHGRWLCARLPGGACTDAASAGHFASFQAVSTRLGPPGLDPASDPVGFDRETWQRDAGDRIERFLADALRR